MANPVIILGAGSIGKAALEIFGSNGVEVYCFLDDDTLLHNMEIGHAVVLGSTDDDDYLGIIGSKCDAFVATDDMKLNAGLVKLLKEKRKVMPVNAIHSGAHISGYGHFGYGNFINAGVKIGSFAVIGNHNILHTDSIVEHTAQIGDCVQLGAGSIVNSGARIDNNVFIGSGVTVVSGVHIGKDSRIGAGSVVISEVKAGETFFGNPAQKVE